MIINHLYRNHVIDLTKEVDETELFREDWVVERDGTITTKHGLVIIDGDRLTEKDWIKHMLGKDWVNMRTFIHAYFYALKLRGIKEITITANY